MAPKLPTLSASSANNCTGQGCSGGAAAGSGHARNCPEEAMTKSRFGLIAGFAGAAFAAWWWQHQRSGMSAPVSHAHERGEVIFSNSPVVDDAIGG